MRAAPGEVGSGASRSVTREPDASAIVGNATTRGPPVAARTDPNASIALRSAPAPAAANRTVIPRGLPPSRIPALVPHGMCPMPCG